MNLYDQAIKDCAMITTGSFSRSCDFISRFGQTATINVQPNNIGRKISSDTGVLVNSKNSSVVFSEYTMMQKFPLYPIRATDRKVSMVGDLINVADSTGFVCNYIVQENIPDETTGLITLLLGNYTP